jgi:hypothetical protein
MSKAIAAGAAEIGIAGGLLLLNALVPGVGAVITAAETAALWGMLAGGVATEAGAIASAIGSHGGIGITTRQAAQLRQIVRGEQRIGGTIVYCSTTGSSDRYYNMVIVLATHEIEAIVNLYLDGRQVFWVPGSMNNQTYNGVNFGGFSDGSENTGPNGQQYNFANEVFCAAYLGAQNSDSDAPSGTWIGPSTWNDGDAAYPGFCGALSRNDPTWSPQNVAGPGTASAYCSAAGSLGGGPGGEIDGLVIEYAGFNYADGPVAVTITDLGGPGSGATATATASGGSITSLVLTNPGSGYIRPLVTLAPPTSVTMTPYLGGCAYVYLRIRADSSNFPAFPEIRFTVRGKNDIYDPRTGTRGYSSNWALNIADAITDPAWGLGDNTVNQDQLIAAANVCDEQVACAVGLEARYAVHWHYDTSCSPGDAIARMMDAAAGRLSRIGGEWYIWPAYWQGPSFTLDANSLCDSIQWTPKRPMADLFNRVSGTYIAANSPYNIAGNLYDINGYWEGEAQNNFAFAFQPTNFPMYACDALHGYGAGVDVYLTQDGGITLPREIALECVLSISQAQRLAKIFLLRNRQQGSGSFPMSLAAWVAQPLDVIEFNMPAMSWTGKVLEIVSIKFRFARAENDDAPSSTLLVGVQETDPSVYEWEQAEELTPYDVQVNTSAPSLYQVQPPTALSAVSDLATALVQPNGQVTPRIELIWVEPADTYVQNGGSIEIQMCAHGSAAWQGVLIVGGQTTQVFLGNVVSFQAYDVRIRSIRSNGTLGNWVELDNIVCGFAFSAAGLTAVAPAGTLTAAAYGSTARSRTFILPGALVTVASSFTATYGGQSVACTPATTVLGPLEQEQLYYLYYVDPGFAGGAVTPIATLNPSDFFDKPGYFLIGQILTPPWTNGLPRYLPTAFADVGAAQTFNPGAAFDANLATSAAVTGLGGCVDEIIYSGFPPVSALSTQSLVLAPTVVNAGGSTAQWAITASLGGGAKPPGALNAFNARGAWAATTAYAAWDTFTVTTGSGFGAVTTTYLVVAAYTSGSSFGATDVGNTCVVLAAGTGAETTGFGGLPGYIGVALPAGLKLNQISIDVTSNPDSSGGTAAYNQVLVTEIYIQ